MTIIQISSTNPKFGYVIKKNPNSLPLIKTIKSGLSFGYYTHLPDNTIKENEYNIYFKDSMNQVSYKESTDRDADLDYTNKMRFMSPLCALDLLDAYLSHTTKHLDVDDTDEYENKFYVNLLYVRDSTTRLINLILEQFIINMNIKYNYELKSSNVYSLELFGKKSLRFLLNVAQVIIVLINIRNKIWPQINLDSIGAKLSVSLPLVRDYIPYNLAYMLLSNLNIKTFNAVVPSLKVPNITYLHGHLSERRFFFVLNEISRHKPVNNIIDIGCGEGRFLDLLTKIKNVNTLTINYYCLDIDEKVIEKLKFKKKSKFDEYNVNIIKLTEEQRLIPSEALPLESLKNEHNIVLMMEVIEHMELEDAKILLKNVVNNLYYDKIIISTPNRDFNHNYKMNQQFRHDDHKFEFNNNEFVEYITECCDGINVNKSFCGIGDIVNDVTPTQCVIITKNST